MNILEIAFNAAREYETSRKGTLCLTPYAEQIIEIVRNNPGHHKEFEKQFIEMHTHHRDIPHELLVVCMYHLKFNSVRNYIEEYRSTELSKNNWRAEGPTRDILSAYEEPWEDYDLFYPENNN